MNRNANHSSYGNVYRASSERDDQGNFGSYDRAGPLAEMGMKAASSGKARNPRALVQHTKALSIRDSTLVSIMELGRLCTETTLLQRINQDVGLKAINELMSAARRGL